MKKQKVLFVTGASKGFGFEIVKAALSNGDMVTATVRSHPERLKEAFSDYPETLLIQEMDVTNEEQIKLAVVRTLVDFGRIDVLINNAGYGVLTAIEEASDEEVRQQYNTNVFGLLNVIRAVLPSMRLNRSGHIINISSLFGFDAIPGWALYGSTKFAVEGISKGLAVELAPLGIKVTAVEPGIFRTGFLSEDSVAIGKNVIADYHDTVGVVRDSIQTRNGKQPGDPRKFARIIVELAHTEKPPVQMPVGPDAVIMFYKSMGSSNRIIQEWGKLFTGYGSPEDGQLI